MKKNYNFSKMKQSRPKALKHLHADVTKGLKKPISIRLEEETIEYFKEQAEQTGLKYQTVINMHLNRIAKAKGKLGI